MGLSALQGVGMKRFDARQVIVLVVVLVSMSNPAIEAQTNQTHLLVITGLGGDPDYTQQFHEWAMTLIGAAENRYNVPPEGITYLGEKPNLDPEAIADRSTRENVESAIQTISDRASSGDHVVIVLFGHGSFTDAARINLPRQDLSAEDFATLLEKLNGQQVTFVNTASASGPFVETLSAQGRTVMTATRTGGERNASVFGGYFVAAFAGGEDDADQNRDRRVSMLEAFSYARARVVQSYEADGLLATEHALLDDNGDGEGTDEPDPLSGDNPDGLVARTLFFTSGSQGQPGRTFNNPALEVLYQDRQELEARVDDLRRIRGGSDQRQYQEELEKIMIELALKSREIRELEAVSGSPTDR